MHKVAFFFFFFANWGVEEAFEDFYRIDLLGISVLNKALIGSSAFLGIYISLVSITMRIKHLLRLIVVVEVVYKKSL